MTRFAFSHKLDPVNALLRLQDELASVFEAPFGIDLGPTGRGVFPPVNVFLDPDAAVIRIEVPGVHPENLTIESRGRTLKISGKRENPVPADTSFHRRERWEGEFSRSLQLPEDFEPSRATAECEHGILTVRVPKREEARPRQIRIKSQ